MAYCHDYYPDKHSEYVQLCEDFVAAVHQHDPALLRKQKIHLILHLPESMRKYGPTATFNTERYTNSVLLITVLLCFNNIKGVKHSMAQ